jgi:hypothetical protein
MAEVEGWIKLHRKLMLNELWNSEPFSKGQAWVDLLLLANHVDGNIQVRGIKIPILRGQVGWSEVRLAERWQWSRSKVRHFIFALKKEQQIEQQKNNKTSIITIINYEMYQEKKQQIYQEKDSKKTAKRQQKDTNKNDKNDKNNKNDSNTVSNRTFVPPSFEEVTKYCNERQSGVDPQNFIDFYESKGWFVGKNKMKDWQAAVRTWEKRGKEAQNGPTTGNSTTNNGGGKEQPSRDWSKFGYKG